MEYIHVRTRDEDMNIPQCGMNKLGQKHMYTTWHDHMQE